MRWLPYSSELPQGWSEERLRDVTIRRRGYSWSKEQEATESESNAIPVIRIPNIQDTLDLSDLLYLRDVPPEALTEFAVEKDWILFVASNGNPNRIGDAALLEQDEQMLFASFLQAITVSDRGRLLPEFLAYWLRLERVHGIFSKTSQQTTGLANFSWGAVKNMPVRFPTSTEEQGHIVKVLTTADCAIQAAKVEVREAEAVKAALLNSLFLDGIPGKHTEFQNTPIGRIPVDWQFLRIQDALSEPPFSGVSPESRSEPPGTPILNVSCIKRGRCDPSAVTYVDVDEVTQSQCRARSGDFFVLRGNGNREYVGSGGLLECEPPDSCIFSDKLIRLRFTADVVTEGFLPFMWQSHTFLRRLQSKAESGSGLWMLSKRDIRREWFARPGIGEQQEIVLALRAAQDVVDTARSRQTALRVLKTSLIQSLLIGKLRVKERATA